MQSDTTFLELNYNSDEARESFRKVVSGTPASVDAYLVGGSIRNALFRAFHGKVLTQRDYDQVVTKGSQTYRDYLASQGFEERLYPSRQDEQVAFSKPLNERASAGDSYVNWLVFDLHTVDGTTIEHNIKTEVCFTVNGCAIRTSDIFTRPWQDAVIQVLPTALQDIKDKRLRLNREGYANWPSNFYAMLRMMSVGFTPPSDEEVQLLLKELPKIEHARFERNIKKVYGYVGGEQKARNLVRSLGIDVDVFDEDTVKYF
jgi:hypothetical protein